MIDLVRGADAPDSIETFSWHDLRLHVVTREPLSPDQLQTLRRALNKIDRVGQFAELVAMVLGRHVQIRTKRPSPDIRFEVSR
jgi:hypothetical protein